MSINAHVDSCTPLPCLQTLRHDKKPPSSSWCRRPSFLRKVALHLPMSHRWGSARSPAFCVAQGDPWRQVKAATHRKKATSWKTQCLSLRKLGPMKASVLSRIMIQHSWSITSQGTSEPASTLAGVSTAFIPVLLQLVMPIISCTLCRKSRGTGVEESSSLVGRKSSARCPAWLCGADDALTYIFRNRKGIGHSYSWSKLPVLSTSSKCWEGDTHHFDGALRHGPDVSPYLRLKKQ